MTPVDRSWPDPVLRLGLWAYCGVWWLLLPVIMLYLRKRGRADPLYSRHTAERFGRVTSHLVSPVWVHAVSMGEMRSAAPLVRALLDRGDHVVTTHFTPAGRLEATRTFATDIAAGRMQVVWVPFEFGFAYRRFLQAFTPRIGLTMEVEIWPVMIAASRKHAVPLYMCNAQYPAKSYDKDHRGLGLRARLFGGFAGGFVKSEDQAGRLRHAGLRNIHVTGELRFDQPVPQAQLNAAAVLRAALGADREIITITSVVNGEDPIYIDMIKAAPDKLYIYVPRAPERFALVGDMIAAAGLKTLRRSQVLDADLHSDSPLDCTVLLGDSMGEMYFYLGLCDRAIVGGGFVPKGAHNIIEPLALRKPVIVGPHTWTIVYPVIEAVAAGVCTVVETPAALLHEMQVPTPVTASGIDAFYADHAGGVARTLAALDALHPV